MRKCVECNDFHADLWLQWHISMKFLENCKMFSLCEVNSSGRFLCGGGRVGGIALGVGVGRLVVFAYVINCR